MRNRFLAGLFLIGSVVACDASGGGSDESGSGLPEGEAITLDEFCSSVERRVCLARHTCCLDEPIEGTIDDCPPEAGEGSDAADCPSTVAGIAGEYVPERAGAIVAELDRAIATCEREELFANAYVLAFDAPAVPEEPACNTSCEAGQVCRGDNCISEEGGPCGGLWICDAATQCVSADPPREDGIGVCVPRNADGQACTAASECLGNCIFADGVGVCGPRPLEGESCYGGQGEFGSVWNYECADGTRCLCFGESTGDTMDYRCTLLREIGDLCSPSEPCAGYSCVPLFDDGETRCGYGVVGGFCDL